MCLQQTLQLCILKMFCQILKSNYLFQLLRVFNRETKIEGTKISQKSDCKGQDVAREIQVAVTAFSKADSNTIPKLVVTDILNYNINRSMITPNFLPKLCSLLVKVILMSDIENPVLN